MLIKIINSKKSNLLFFLCFLLVNLVDAQIRDTTLRKKLTINSFCLCETKLSELKQKYNNLILTNVDEMDLGKKCIGTDIRFEMGKGFYLKSEPGIVFQKERDSDYVSKIRLNNTFKGNLPDGTPIDLSKMLLKDLFNLHPEYRNKWSSRDCSDYWSFSNDTISFFVKIDRTKESQFPIDTNYYLNKPIIAVEIAISCRAVRAYNAGYQMLSNKIDPLLFINNIRVQKSDLANIDPNDVALVKVIKDTIELKKFGTDAKGGLIYIEMKDYDRKRYWEYFSSKSKEYLKIVPSPNTDSNIQYILNSKVLEKNFEGDLSLINDKKLKEIKIINKDQLIEQYNIKDKEYGVIITTNK